MSGVPRFVGLPGQAMKIAARLALPGYATGHLYIRASLQNAVSSVGTVRRRLSNGKYAVLDKCTLTELAPGLSVDP